MRLSTGLLCLFVSIDAALAAAGAAPAGAAAVMRLPAIQTTPLVRDDAPAAVILTPDEAPYRELGERLAEAIHQTTGVRPRVESASLYVNQRPRQVKAETLDRHFILLGQFWNNAVLERLYAAYLDPVDAFFPGPAGFELRTVGSPFKHGQNCLVATGSDPAGCRLAVERLIGIITALKSREGIPFQHEIHLTGEAAAVEVSYRKTMDPKLKELDLYTVYDHPQAKLWTGENPRQFRVYAERNLGTAGAFALRYWLTANPADAEAFKRNVLECRKHLDLIRQVQSTDKVNLEYSFAALILGWDAVDECPIFSETERQQITDFIYQLTEMTSKEWFIIQCKDQPLESIDFHGRHNIAGTFAFGMAGQYLLRHCKLAPEQRQMAADLRDHAAQYLRRLAQSYFYSDGPGLVQNDGELVMRYSLLTGNFDYIDNGNLKKFADYCVVNHDNHGFYASSGANGLPAHSAVGGEVLNVAGYLYPESGYQWFRRRIGRWPYYNFTLYMGPWAGINVNYFFNWEMPPSDEGAQRIRQWAEGITILPLADAFEADIRQNPDKWTGGYGRIKGRYHYDPVPPGRGWKRLSLRGGLEPGNPYLLLDGMQGVEWSFDDIQSIVYYNDLGRRLIRPQLNDTANRLEMNTLFSSDGRPGGKQSLASELKSAADLGTEALLELCALNHDSTTWTRRVFWRKSAWFLIDDEVQPNASGSHFLANSWITQEPLMLDGPDAARGARDDTSTAVLHIVGTPDRTASLIEEDGKVQGFRQKTYVELAPKQDYHLWTLLYANGPRRPETWTLKRLGPSTVLIAGSAGAGPAQHEQVAFAGLLELGSLHIEAALGMISPERLTVSQCRRILIGDKPLLQSNEPDGITLGWDLAANAFEAGKAGYGLQAGARPETLKAERGRMIEAIGKIMNAAKEQPEYKPAPAQSAKSSQTPPLPVLRAMHLRKPVSLAAADLDGSGNDQLLLYKEDGSPRFEYPAFTAAPVAVDFDGKRHPDIALASDKDVLVYHPDGTPRLKHETNLKVTSLGAGDLNDDGRDELDIGMFDWAITIDAGGKRLFDAEVPGRQALSRLFGRIEPQEKMEVVAIGALGILSVHSPGNPRRTANWQSYIGSRPCRIWLRDLTGLGYNQCFIGGGGTDPACYDVRGATAAAKNDPNKEPGNLNRTKLLWTFSGVPIHPNDAALADLAGGGQTELICGGEDGFLYVLDTRGQFLLSRALGAPILKLETVPGHKGTGDQLAVGLGTGKVVILQGKDLRDAGWIQVGAKPVAHLVVLKHAQNPGTLVAADEDGHATWSGSEAPRAK